MLPQLLTMGLLLPFNFFKLSFFTKSAPRLLFTVNEVTQHKDRAIRAKSAHQRCQNTTVSLPFRVSAPAWWENPLKADKLEDLAGWTVAGGWKAPTQRILYARCFLTVFLKHHGHHCQNQTRWTSHLTHSACSYFVTSSHCSRHAVVTLNIVLFLRRFLPLYNPSNTSIRTLPPASAIYTDLRGGELITGTVGCFNYSETNWKTSLNTDPESAALCWECSYKVLMLLIIELWLGYRELRWQNFDPIFKLMLAILQSAERRNKDIVYIKSAWTGIRWLELVHKERMKHIHFVNRNA